MGSTVIFSWVLAVGIHIKARRERERESSERWWKMPSLSTAKELSDFEKRVSSLCSELGKDGVVNVDGVYCAARKVEKEMCPMFRWDRIGFKLRARQCLERAAEEWSHREEMYKYKSHCHEWSRRA